MKVKVKVKGKMVLSAWQTIHTDYSQQALKIIGSYISKSAIIDD